jgi:hypothetical protein
VVDSYKYLGFELTTTFDPDAQWAKVRSKVCSTKYLLKQLKLNGWSTHMLIAAYRAYFLSHFNYSAIMLTSASAAAKREMTSLNARLWRIIGIEENSAVCNNLLPITEHIDSICKRTLQRIIADPTHPVTMSLARNTRPDSRFAFTTQRAKKAAYNNSFLQKFLRILRNEANNQGTRASLYVL